MKFKIIFLTTFVAVSCCPKLYPHKTENIKHMVVVTETVRDTVIRVQPDSSIVQALIKCDSTGRARLEEIRTLKESTRIQQRISLTELGYNSLANEHSNSSGRHKVPATVLTITSNVDSLGIYLQYKERHKEEQQVQTMRPSLRKKSMFSNGGKRL